MKLKLTLTVVAIVVATPALSCAPAPSCWLSEGPSYVKGICRGYAKDKRTKAEIREFLTSDETKPEDMDKFFAACKKHGITFNESAAHQAEISSVTCKGQQAGAHTLVIGNCSFEGDTAKQVRATCVNENDVCLVKAHGSNNGHDMLMITSVESVELARNNLPLSNQEVAMAKKCKAGKPCFLTCNRASEAGRNDLVRAGACAE